MTTKTLQDIKPGEHFIVATHGMRGHFACEMWMNNEDIPDTVFPEPWQSDPATFATKEEAQAYAVILAGILDLPYVA
jgi:hypothetical protein